MAAVCRGLARNAAGGAAIEMAFIAPVLVFLAAAMVDFGLGIYAKMAVADAAQAGAAYAQLNANCSNTTTCFNYISCTSNSPACAFDTAVVGAAEKVAPSNLFMTAPTATAQVLYCCLNSASSGVDLGVNQSNCAQAGSTPPTCSPTPPTAGTYVYITASSNVSTLLPYSLITKSFNLGINIANPLTMTSNYLVRIQ
ncbi:MAG TPA: TadE/TadG family type IV pilus assembly protein [Stellaceae bacterium]|nr:TadE/TadG family type IV pilus assembly protein [Stellaceae bacterium]